MRSLVVTAPGISTSVGSQPKRLIHNPWDLRWLILPFIAGGHFLLMSPMVSRARPTVHLAVLVTIVAAGFLLTRLRGPIRDTLWVWSLLFIFLIGYYLKIYLLSRIVGTPAIGTVNPEWQWVTTATLADSYYWTALAFTIFALSAWFAIGPPRPLTKNHDRDRPRMEVAAVNLLLLSVMVAGILVTFLQWRLGIGILGVHYTRLPFHLDTLIFRVRENVVPALLVLLIWETGRHDRRRLWALAVGGFVLLGVLGAILTTSRGEIAIAALSLAVLWLVTGHLTARRAILSASLIVVALLAIPVITHLRQLALHLPASWMSPTDALQFLVLRVTGADGIWYASKNLPPLFSVGRFSHLVVDQIGVYFSRDIVGIRRPDDFREPGLVGALMLLAGLPGLVAFMAIYVRMIGSAWRFCATALHTAPIALTFGAIFVMKFTTSGSLMYQDVVAVVVSIAMCEGLFRVTSRGYVRAASTDRGSDFAAQEATA